MEEMQAARTSASPAVRPLTTTSVRKSRVLRGCARRRIVKTAPSVLTSTPLENVPLRVRQPREAKLAPRVRVDRSPPRTLQPRRHPTDIALIPLGRKLGPKDVTRRHADEDGGGGPGEGLFRAKEGAGEREGRGVAAKEAAKDGGRGVAQREHDDRQDGNICVGCERLCVRVKAAWAGDEGRLTPRVQGQAPAHPDKVVYCAVDRICTAHPTCQGKPRDITERPVRKIRSVSTYAAPILAADEDKLCQPCPTTCSKRRGQHLP